MIGPNEMQEIKDILDAEPVVKKEGDNGNTKAVEEEASEILDATPIK